MSRHRSFRWLHACVSWTYTHVSLRDIWTYTYTNALYVCRVCSRENRPRGKACPWYIEPATISDNLFRKQWKRTPHREWMNIQGLSNDWVSQKSGLLPTRDSSPQAREVGCKFNWYTRRLIGFILSPEDQRVSERLRQMFQHGPLILGLWCSWWILYVRSFARRIMGRICESSYRRNI